jgi:hypothetical protein
MNLAKELARRAGKDTITMFSAKPALAVLTDDGKGVKITKWDAAAIGYAQPSPADVAAILAAPEPAAAPAAPSLADQVAALTAQVAALTKAAAPVVAPAATPAA